MGVFSVVKIRKVFWISAIVCILVALAGCTVVATALAATKRVPIYCVEDSKKVAITFDAAWGADKTRSIVDVLCAKGIRATFFLTGFWIEAFPSETLYIKEKEMQIGNHSANHKNMGKMSKDACFQEIEQVNRQLYQLASISPTVFRAPFGDYGNNLIETLDMLSMRCIQWDVDSLDWKGLGAQELIQRVVGKCVGGSIILCHNNSDHILEALDGIIEGIQNKGYEFVTIDELLQDKQGKIDHSGRLKAI